MDAEIEERKRRLGPVEVARLMEPVQIEVRARTTGEVIRSFRSIRDQAEQMERFYERHFETAYVQTIEVDG